MRKSALFLFLIGAVWSCTPVTVEFKTADCFWPDTYTSHPRHHEFQQLLDDYTQQGIPGINLLVHQDQQAVWVGSSGLSRIESNQPLLPCHPMPAGSVSKIFCGLATMMMVEEGLLDLDASLEQYLGEEYTSLIPNGKQVHLAHLLSHTSGIPDFATRPGFLLDVINNKDLNTARELILEKYVHKKSAVSEPGAAFSYSNSNYELLTLILDEVYPDGHADFYTNRIFSRLGLKKTWYKNETDYYTLDSKGMANGYFDRFSDGTLENATEVSLAIAFGLTGSAGIVTQVMDLHTLLQAIFETDIITEDTLDKMLTHILKKEGLTEYAFGLGLAYKDFGQHGRAIGHTGKMPGYASEAWYFPEKNTYVIYQANLGNALDGPAQEMLDQEFRTVLIDRIFN